MKTYIVHFTFLHKGFFWYHQTVEFNVMNRDLLMGQIFLYLRKMEHQDFETKAMQIDEAEESRRSTVG